MGNLGIVDTSVVISFLRDESPSAEKIERVLRGNTDIFSVITAFELKLGENDYHRPSLDPLFENVRIDSIDTTIAGIAATVYQNLENQGQRIGLRDTFIAATALCNNLPVYTLDTSHFSRIENVEVLSLS